MEKKKRIYNRITRTHKTQFKKQEGIRITHIARSNYKLFWKEIKSQYKQSSEESQTLNTNDMYTQFNELYGSDSTEHDDQEDTNYEIDDNDLDITFTQKN